MPRAVLDTLKVLGIFAVVIGLAAALLYGAVEAQLPLALPALLSVMLFGVWASFAYVRYREGRREEVRELLTAAVLGGMPLDQAVRAFIDDRPSRGSDWYRLVLVFCVLVPISIPLWLWLRSRTFDRRLTRFVEMLELGVPLSTALRDVPEVASRETRLAAAIGAAAGDLPGALRSSGRERLGAAWFEVAPRLFYPFFLLLFVSGIVAFLTDTILPRYRKIFEEFGRRMPNVTREVSSAWECANDAFILPAFFGVVLLFAAVLIASPTVRWYTPIVGRMYRMDMRGLVLRTLGLLLGAGRTVPHAIGFLCPAPELPDVVRRRLRKAREAALRGEPLADALQAAGLLSASMAPLVRSAERARTLPWALRELGEHLRGRAFRMMRRVSLALTPILVIAIGVLVGTVALAFFMPLIQLLTGLTQ